MLFSATMPGAIVALARRYMRQPTHIRAMGDPSENAHTVKAIEQFVYRAHAMDKVEMLSRILQARGRGLTLVFSRTKRTAAKVAEDLTERGFAAAAIHGDLGQGAREQALRAFRHGNVDVLVATDVAARGIDVENVTHVVNFQCPEDEKTYVHRIGRTARAGNTGIAITFVDWDDMPRWGLINRQLDLGIPEPEETYSSSDHLYAELDIPTDVTGRLGTAQQTRAGLEAEELEDLGETGKASGRRGKRPEPRREATTEERPRRTRNRRRTVHTHASDGDEPTEPAARPSATAAGTEAYEASASTSTPRRPRRRRRRGNGEGAGSGAAAPASTEG
jgi:superfamily II DNA/RNA helicase